MAWCRGRTLRLILTISKRSTFVRRRTWRKSRRCRLRRTAHGLTDRLILLRSGGAAGFGVGPIVVARLNRPVGGRVAIPGEGTTAALLLRQLGRFNTIVMRFDQIENAVLRGDADCGVLIHEGRFTYQAKGLTLIEDLGSVWEERMRSPLPLAAIAIRRDLVHLAPQVDRRVEGQRRICLRQSERERRLRCSARAGDASRRDARGTFSCM